MAVLATYLRLDPAEHAGRAAYPAEYGRLRAGSAAAVVDRIRDLGGTAVGMEADLADPAVPRRLFDHAEATLGPVEILVNNASGWLANTFLADSEDRFGRGLRPVDAEGHDGSSPWTRGRRRC